jgi:hypothetical protein
MKRSITVLLFILSLTGFSQTMTFDTGVSESGFTFSGYQYDSAATDDDGSCTIAGGNACPTDLNGDCQTNTADLLDFLVAFGTVCDPCN